MFQRCLWQNIKGKRQHFEICAAEKEYKLVAHTIRLPSGEAKRDRDCLLRWQGLRGWRKKARQGYAAEDFTH